MARRLVQSVHQPRLRPLPSQPVLLLESTVPSPVQWLVPLICSMLQAAPVTSLPFAKALQGVRYLGLVRPRSVLFARSLVHFTCTTTGMLHAAMKVVAAQVRWLVQVVLVRHQYPMTFVRVHYPLPAARPYQVQRLELVLMQCPPVSLRLVRQAGCGTLS